MNTDIFMNRPGEHDISAMLCDKDDDAFIALTVRTGDTMLTLFVTTGQAYRITMALGVELNKVGEKVIEEDRVTLPECSTCGALMRPRVYREADNSIDWSHGDSDDGGYWTCTRNPFSRPVKVANIAGNVHADDFAALHSELVLP